MGQSVIGALRANLGLNSAKFEKGAQRVKTPMQRLKSDLKAIVGIATAAGVALVGAAVAGAQEIDESAKAARRLGASVGAFRALELAAGEAGVNLSSLTSDLQTMDREIASIGVSGNGERALKKLGLTVKDLSGLDADEKIALIADKIADLGLSTGETTAVLRDLGVRNREMVLLMSQGGDAIRAARRDIEDYGLALNSTDASRIEVANDAIARLGRVGQYVGQRLALSIVPALGDMAKAITDSLRVGGALRAMIDGLIDNLGRFATYMATAVALVGVRFVAAFAAAKLAAFSFAGSLLFLRGALIRSGIGLLVVGAGELVYRFGKLVSAAGGWGLALQALGDLAQGVWQGIKTSAKSIAPALTAIWANVKAGFFNLMSEISEAWAGLLSSMAVRIKNVPALSSTFDALSEAAGTSVENMAKWDAKASSAKSSAGRLKKEAEGLAAKGWERVNRALKTLTLLMSTADGDMTDGASAAADLAAALKGIKENADETGGSVKDTTEKVGGLKEALKDVRQTAVSSFAQVLTGAKSLRDAVSGILQSIGNKLAELAVDGLFSDLGSILGGKNGGKGGGFWGGLRDILGFANGTNSAPGGIAMVGERGPELVNLPQGSRVHTAQATKDMLSGATGNAVLRVELGEGLKAEMRGEMRGIAVETTKAGLEQYDTALPDRFAQIEADPELR